MMLYAVQCLIYRLCDAVGIRPYWQDFMESQCAEALGQWRLISSGHLLLCVLFIHLHSCVTNMILAVVMSIPIESPSWHTYISVSLHWSWNWPPVDNFHLSGHQACTWTHSGASLVASFMTAVGASSVFPVLGDSECIEGKLSPGEIVDLRPASADYDV